MRQTIFKIGFEFFGVLVGVMVGVLVSGMVAAKGPNKNPEQNTPELRQSIKELFNHKRHNEALSSSGMECVDCHSFSIKSSTSDPLVPEIPGGLIHGSPKVCHLCHLGKVEAPRVHQCSLCHLNQEQVKPATHFSTQWKRRHGRYAQLAPDSCMLCHKENQLSCMNCHTQRNTVKPNVHRANFRLTHSIDARSNPAQCATCHNAVSFCIQCHQGGKR